jgi:hypothetical protein
MRKTYLLLTTILFLSFLSNIVLFAGNKQGKDKMDRNIPLCDAEQVLYYAPYNTNIIPVPFIFPLDPGYTSDSISLGPEILTGLQGWYDYKTNGEVNKFVQVDKSSPNYIHVVDYQTDSLEPGGATRRWTLYANSTDAGSTWTVFPNTPLLETTRSGFCVLALSSDGGCFIANHTTDGSTRLDAVLYNEIVPHTANFILNRHPNENSRPYGIWPQICVYGNGNVGLISRRNVSTNQPAETLYYSYWNGNQLSDRVPIFITGPDYIGSVGSNMRFNLASDGGSIATAVAAPVLLNDTLGASRIYFMTTTNSGTNWSAPKVLFAPYTENNGEDTIVASGGSGFIYKPGTNHWFYAFPISADGYYSTGKIVMTRSTDGGNTLSTYTICTAAQVGAATTYYKPMAFVFNVDFPALGWSNDNSTLYCVYSVVVPDTGASGWNSRDIFIQYSLDEGATWSNPFRVTNTPDIDETYPSISNWNKGSVGNPYEINIIYMKDPGVGPASFNGNSGTAPPSLNKQIYRKLTGLPPIGIKNISGNVPGVFSLGQNYPNPFNPKTQFTINIAKSGLVTVKVFDIIGREIAVLVNEELQPGIYNVDWNAINSPSGVYFYKIEANGFTDTKKMMLVK